MGHLRQRSYCRRLIAAPERAGEVELQVVRTDGAPLTFVVALVRGLAATLSVFVFFLGFLWIAWDNSKQGWHDKIAGTEVVRLPRATPLV